MPYTARKHGFSTEQFPVSAYVGSSKNLKDLKDLRMPCTASASRRRASSERTSLSASAGCSRACSIERHQVTSPLIER